MTELENQMPADQRPPIDPTAAAPMLHSAELFAGKQELLIEHSGSIYRLRITRSGKLILQK